MANQPEKKFVAGAISATIWKNEGKTKQGQPISYLTIALDRRYTDQGGQWKSTSSMRINDLPKAMVVLQEAYKYIVLKGASEGKLNDEYAPEIEDIVM